MTVRSSPGSSPSSLWTLAWSPGAGYVLQADLAALTVADCDVGGPRPRWARAQAWARSRSGGWHLYAPPGLSAPPWADPLYDSISREHGYWSERPVELAWVSPTACDAVRMHCARLLALASIALGGEVRTCWRVR